MRACSCIVTIWITTLIVSSPMLIISQLSRTPDVAYTMPASTLTSPFPTFTSTITPINSATNTSLNPFLQTNLSPNSSTKHLGPTLPSQQSLGTSFSTPNVNLFKPISTAGPTVDINDFISSDVTYSCYTSMESRWANFYYISMVLLFFLGPLVMLLLLYLVIAQRLVHDTNTAELHRKSDLPNMRARKQVVVMLVTVTIFFFVSLLPFRVLSLWMIFDFDTFRHLDSATFLRLLYSTRLLLYLNSAINPVLYNLTSTKFRDAFWRFLTRSAARDMMRRSTFTTATSLSNGRQSSARSSTTGQSPRNSLRASFNLYKQSSLTNFSVPGRQLIARYGRHGNFETSTSTSTYSHERENSRRLQCAQKNKHGVVSVNKLTVDYGDYCSKELTSFSEMSVLPPLTEVSSNTPSVSPQKENLVMNILNFSNYSVCDQADTDETNEVQV
ncbi:uncharacterized protein LOC108671689 [Hyalella azteca]|uniref:Uncharacterized protein LOC108671689 n=1 Tax=Hyalella azteca TaxID=294128 RepID=A0A8B7NM64_HYAAZ|nr:uncharacterized protein LOC108671689 [Hyalella azteca]